MSDSPIQLLVAIFGSENDAMAAYKLLRDAHKDKVFQLTDVAVVTHNKDNKIRIHEAEDVGGGKGAVFGTIVGGVLGALAGPLGAVVIGGAAGALVGGIAAKVIDMGIPDDRLKEIGGSLLPGSSAVVVILEENWAEDVQQRLELQGARVVTERIKLDEAVAPAAESEAASDETEQASQSAASAGQDPAAGGDEAA